MAQLGKEIMDSGPSYVDINPNIVPAHAAASAQDVAQDVQIILPDEPSPRFAATRRIRKDPFPGEVEPYTETDEGDYELDRLLLEPPALFADVMEVEPPPGFSDICEISDDSDNNDNRLEMREPATLTTATTQTFRGRFPGAPRKDIRRAFDLYTEAANWPKQISAISTGDIIKIMEAMPNSKPTEVAHDVAVQYELTAGQARSVRRRAAAIRAAELSFAARIRKHIPLNPDGNAALVALTFIEEDITKLEQRPGPDAFE